GGRGEHAGRFRDCGATTRLRPGYPRHFVVIQVSTDGRSAGHNWVRLEGPIRAMSTPVEITWLLAAVAKGDGSAFERLYAATCAKLYGVVLRILRRPDLAADVMEEAYLQIWKRAGEFDPGQSTPLAWMVAIARRLAIDLSRRPQSG